MRSYTLNVLANLGEEIHIERDIKKNIFKENLTFEKCIFIWQYEMISLLYCANINIHEFKQF